MKAEILRRDLLKLAACAAVKESRKLDAAEKARHGELSAEMWRNLPPHYHWLREWELV